MFDVVVIGAGPAGSSAATETARRGLSALIIDKEVFPRDKPCGGAVSGRGMSYLSEPIPSGLIQREIHEARIGFSSVTRSVHRDDIMAVVVDRAAFDHYLLQSAQAAGARAKLGERVHRLTDTGSHVEVETSRGTYHARFAVVAEGAFGGLKTRVRRKDRPDEMGLCAVTDVPAATEEIEGFPGSTLEMQLGVAGYGYGWVFPHDDHFSVGVGDMARLMSGPRARLADFLTAVRVSHLPSVPAGTRPLPPPVPPTAARARRQSAGIMSASAARTSGAISADRSS
ncbi:MAG: FAD-dependent oxidoreductase [Spirochaetes bacterium]|jgi:geranylgeranyl reductase family protein|nr:FAD-dependent oxidoreductase [Spirochaetota bacterium]